MSLLRPLGYISLYFKPFSNNSAIFVYYHWFYDILDYIIPAISQAFFSRPFFCLEFSRIFNPELNEPDRAATWSKLGNNNCSEHDWVSTVLSLAKIWTLPLGMFFSNVCLITHLLYNSLCEATVVGAMLWRAFLPGLYLPGCIIEYPYLYSNYTIFSCIIWLSFAAILYHS